MNIKVSFLFLMINALMAFICINGVQGQAISFREHSLIDFLSDDKKTPLTDLLEVIKLPKKEKNFHSTSDLNYEPLLTWEEAKEDVYVFMKELKIENVFLSKALTEMQLYLDYENYKLQPHRKLKEAYRFILLLLWKDPHDFYKDRNFRKGLIQMLLTVQPHVNESKNRDRIYDSLEAFILSVSTAITVRHTQALYEQLGKFYQYIIETNDLQVNYFQSLYKIYVELLNKILKLEFGGYEDMEMVKKECKILIQSLAKNPKHPNYDILLLNRVYGILYTLSEHENLISNKGIREEIKKEMLELSKSIPKEFRETFEI